MRINLISPQDPISQLALRGLLETCPELGMLEFYSKAGSADSLKRKRIDGDTTSIFRSVNDENSPTPPENTYDAVPKKIVSFDASVDVVLEDRNEDIDTELATQTYLDAREAGYLLKKKIYEGDTDVDSEEFNGLRNLVNASFIKNIATNGLQIPLGNSDAVVAAQQRFMESLLEQLELVRGGAQYLAVPSKIKNRLLIVAKNLGYYRQTKDEIGNVIEKINDVIVYGAGYEKDGTALLPFNETVGANNDCSSMFAFRVGERTDLTALTSVGVKGRYAGQVKNLITNNVNFDMSLALPDLSALVQIKGLRV